MDTRTKTALVAEVVAITPDMAAKWLQSNAANRRVRNIAVAQYANDMNAGQWLMTGEPIKFSTDGRLLDGQHRLHAIVESGETVTMLVITNVDPVAQRAMDTGRKRSAADHLQMLGHKNASLLASIAKLDIVNHRGLLYRDRMTWNVSAVDIERHVAEHEDITEAVNITRAYVPKIDAQPSVIGLAVLLTNRANPVAAAEFWRAIVTLTGLTEGSPIAALVSRLSEARRRNVKIDQVALLSLFIRAWNAWRAGRTMRSIPVMKNGKAIRFSYVSA